MADWSEILGPVARAGTRRGNGKQSNKSYEALSASPELLRRAAKPRSLFETALHEAGAFFHPAGVLAKNAVDFVAHPIDNLPFVGKGNTEGLGQILRAVKASQQQPMPEVNPSHPLLAQLGEAAQVEAWSNAQLPSIDPVLDIAGKAASKTQQGLDLLERGRKDARVPPMARAALNLPPVRLLGALAHPKDTWSQIFNGTNSDDGDLNAVLGSRGQELWQPLQHDVQRVQEAQRGDDRPYVQRVADAALPGSAAQYFDPQAADIASTASEAGFSPADSIGLSLLNPLEWLNAESGGTLAKKLRDAGKTGRLAKAIIGHGAAAPGVTAPLLDKLNTARRAVNQAGRLMDPVSLGLDAAGSAVAKAKSVDWKLPGGKKSAAPTLEELQRLSGVEAEDFAKRLAEVQAADSPGWAELLEDGASPASRNDWEDLAQSPYESSIEAATEGQAVPRARSIPAAAESELGLPLQGSAPDTLLDEAMQAAEQQDYLQAFRHQQEARSAALDAGVGAKLSTKSNLPLVDVEDVIRWGDFEPGGRAETDLEALLRASDPGSANPSPASFDPLHTGQLSQNAVEAVTRASQSWEVLLRREGSEASVATRQAGEQFAADLAQQGAASEAGIEAKLAGLSPRVLPEMEGAGQRLAPSLEEALKASDPGVANPNPVSFDPLSAGAVSPSALDAVRPSSSWESLLSDTASVPAVSKSQQGIKLYSNPFDVGAVWSGLQDLSYSVGQVMRGLEARVGAAFSARVTASPILDRIQTGLKRVFSENFGVLAPEVGARISDASLAANAIRRTALETVAPVLETASASERHALMNYMARKIDRKEAAQLGLPVQLMDAGDGVRALMDDASDSLMATQLNLDKRFLADASTEGKELIRSLVESYRKPMNRNATLKAAREALAAGTTYNAAFVSKAENLIDAGLQQMERQGLVDAAGNIVDMGLPMAAYIKNRGTYSPRLYKMFEYGVDLRSPRAASEFLDALEARHSAIAAEAGVPHKPFPQEFRSFVLAHYSGGATPSAAARAEAGRLMKRKDLSQEMLSVLGPIANPSYAYAKGVADVQLLNNTLKLRRWVAGQDRFVSRPGETVEAFIQRTGFKEHDIAYDFATNQEYASRAGALKGRFIHRDMADLLAATGTIPHLAGADALDKLKETLRIVPSLSWVILNPSSHFRQLYQNTVGVWGVSGLSAFRDIPAAFREMRGKAGQYLEARDAGLFSAGHDANLWQHLGVEDIPEFTFDGNQHVLAKLGRLSGYFSTLFENAGKAYGTAKNGARKVANKAGDAFGASDDLAKLALYKHFRRAGDAPTQAVERVRSELYIGAKNSRYEQFMSGKSIRRTYYDRGASLPNGAGTMLEGAGLIHMNPFFGASRFLWEQAWRNAAGVAAGHWMPLTDPARLARNATLMASLYGLHELSKYASGVTGEQESLERPDYMRPIMPTFTMLPPQMSQLISDDGSHDWLDWSSLHPFGAPSQGKWDVKSNSMSGLAGNLAGTFIPGAGTFSKFTGDGANDGLNPMLKPLLEVFRDNRDSFSGRAIYPEQMGMQAKVRPAMAHLWRSYAPPWAPNPLGLAQALTALPSDPKDSEQWENMVRAGMQGLANDSGHQFSKAAAAIVNSWDYWWSENGGKLEASRRITDYRGRIPYLAKTMADIAGFRIETRAAGEMEALRVRRRKAVVAGIKREYAEQMRNLSGGALATKKAERDDAVRTVMSGQPDPRWYDEGPSDTLQNWFQQLAASRGKSSYGAPGTF